MKFERPRGTRDFSPSDMERRDYILSQLRKVFESYAFERIETPVFEHTELFTTKSGQEITENLYTFKDKSGRDLCLRPELTASVARMYVSELAHMRKPVKLYYFGPMYRYERPQKGRYREFWQAGAELIGVEDYGADAEIVCLAADCLDRLGLRYELRLSHLGIIRGLLSDFGLSEEKQDEVLGLLDRDELEQVGDFIRKDAEYNLLKNLMEKKSSTYKDHSKLLKTISSELKGYGDAIFAIGELEKIVDLLVGQEINFIVDLGLSRGLSYYTDFVFDVRVEGLGAQDQVCGGGRYDNLIELFGGQPTPAVGFAFGFDRLVEALKLQGISFPEETFHVAVIPTTYEEDTVKAPTNDKEYTVKDYAVKIARNLRKEGFSVDYDVAGHKLKDQLSHASQAGVKYAVIIGPRELEKGKVVLRNMATKEEKQVEIDKLPKKIH
ncbi:MAG: histidine--tRNA ligase [Candidatus Altiarchaeota archaeon]